MTFRKRQKYRDSKRMSGCLDLGWAEERTGWVGGAQGIFRKVKLFCTDTVIIDI